MWLEHSEVCAATMMPAELLHGSERERLRFVPLHDVRSDLRFGKLPHGFPQLNLFRSEIERHYERL